MPRAAELIVFEFVAAGENVVGFVTEKHWMEFADECDEIADELDAAGNPNAERSRRMAAAVRAALDDHDGAYLVELVGSEGIVCESWAETFESYEVREAWRRTPRAASFRMPRTRVCVPPRRGSRSRRSRRSPSRGSPPGRPREDEPEPPPGGGLAGYDAGHEASV